MITHHQFKIPWHSSLVVRSLASIFVLLCIIFAIAGLYRIENLNKKMLFSLNEEGKYIAKITSQAISLPLWNVDDEQVKEQLKALSNGKSFCGARVLDATNSVFSNEKFPNVINHDQYVISQEILYKGSSAQETEKIGYVELCISKVNALKEINNSIQFELIFFSIIILSSLAAYYAAFLIIASPLLNIRKAMETLDETMEPIGDQRLLKANEIGALSYSFNKMVKKISNSYNALKREKERAVKADMAKTEFLTNMSHELRTPLNIIIGMTQILKGNDIPDDHKESFEIIKNSSKTLLKIVDDILDLSKIEAGEMNLEHIPFNLGQKIIDVTKGLQPLAQEKGLEFLLSGGTEDYWVLGDPIRFERIITNLVSNAIRYTKNGFIKIETRIKEYHENSIIFECAVSDSGIGIAKENLGKVFEKFSQADNSTTRLYGGTGLGLTITKKLLSMMNGNIKLKSQLGVGSTFTFEIPFDFANPENHKNGNIINSDSLNITKQAKDSKILLAEDNHMNQIFMKKLFQGLGIEHITIVANGLEAVNAVLNESFDVVFMDYSMPVMNGYEATIRIRSQKDETIKNIPIIALTANALFSDKQKCVECGMNDYISKPFEMENFKKVLSQWIRL